MNRRESLSAISVACLSRNAAAQTGPAFGVYLGAGCTGADRQPAYARWLGRDIDIPIDFLNATNGNALLSSATWIARCWQRAGYKRISLGVPLLTHDEHDSLDAVAAGHTDERFKRIGADLVAHGLGSSILRLAWEFNGRWYPWRSADRTDLWVRAWHHVAETLKRVPGATFQLEWTVAIGAGLAEPTACWPGADHVDIVGMNVYNQSWRHRKDPASDARWQELRAAPAGIDALLRLAARSKRPLAIPEWGTGDRPEGTGGGDDPHFVEAMARLLHAETVLYHGYWEYPASDYDAQLSTGRRPRAAQAFLTRFGNSASHRLPAEPPGSPRPPHIVRPRS